MSFDREHANKQRELLAEEIVGIASGCTHIVIELPTGTGKGRICAKCIIQSRSEKPWLVVVPEIAQVENYKKDLKKHGLGHLLETKIEDVICYASLKKYKEGIYNLHLNEVHRVSEARTEILSTIKYDQIVSDSATINQEVKDRLQSIEPFVLYRKSMQEVIDMGILPEPLIQCIPVELDDTAKEYSHNFGKKTVILTAKEKYKTLCSNISYWEQEYMSPDIGGKQWQKNKWMQVALDRKRFLAAYKTDHARSFISSVKGRKVVFCGSVEQATTLGGRLSIHAKNSKKENKEIIDDFNYRVTNSLFSCMMGVEGMNFTDVDAGFIIQLDNTERLPLQKTGRIFRSDIPELYVLYVPGTQDEKYLTKFLKNFDPKYIKGYEQEKQTVKKATTTPATKISGSKRGYY